jgi:hypothetical protein
MKQLLNSLRKNGKISLLFTGLAAFVIVVIGLATMVVAKDVKIMKKYLDNASMIQPNFEDNIILYTSKTEKLINSLLSLRPKNEDEYVTFLSNLEKVGQRLSLNIDVKSLGGVQIAPIGGQEKVLYYTVSFYGGSSDLMKFVEQVEKLPYFIKVVDVNYRNLDHLSADEKKTQNIHMKLMLYIK